MAKIVMWGFSAAGSDEQKLYLQNLVKSNSDFDFQEGNAKQISSLDNCLVLLLHDSVPSSPSLMQWKVECSGGITQAQVNTTQKTAGIPFATVVENLQTFLTVTKDRNEVTSQDIELLLAIDPKLEEKLLPFESASPYETANKQGEILKDAKTKLQTYVGELLKKQSK